MQKQLQSVPVHEVEVDVSAAVIKARNVSWFISAWESLQGGSEVIIYGFKKTGILDAVTINPILINAQQFNICQVQCRIAAPAN